MTNQKKLIALLLPCIMSTFSHAEDAINLTVNSYHIIGDSSPLDADEIKQLLSPYTGESIQLIQIQQASKVLEDQFRRMGYGFYQVTLAPQTLNTGQVTLSIKSLKINEIQVDLSPEQAAFFSKENIINSVPALKQGQSPNLHQISKQVEMGNLNNAKEINVQFLANENQDNQIDANIQLNAQKPSRYFAWIDNTGRDETGDYRLGVGYKNNNLWDLDHELSLSFITSPDHIEDVQQYGINYRIPLYAYQGVWQLYTYYSDVDSGTVAGGFDVSGQGLFYGTKYEWHLPRFFQTKTYSHQLVLGIEDKQFNNDVNFKAQSLGSDVRSIPLSIAYKGQWRNVNHTAKFYLQYAHNLEFGNDNNDTAYALSRFNANPDWDVLKGGLTHQWTEHGYRLLTQIDLQYSDQALISGEQFGLGGMNSQLRGFEERETSGDRGMKGSIELWSPSLWKDQFNLLGFFDAGVAYRISPLANELKSDTLLSAGVGLAWHWQQYTYLNLYFAHIIDGNDSKTVKNATQADDNVVQFSFSVNY